jgi:hypothetical protein
MATKRVAAATAMEDFQVLSGVDLVDIGWSKDFET